jgi:WD40 repeat protein
MLSTINSSDNLILERRKNISNYLTIYLPKELTKIVSEYDYHLEGKSFTLKSYSKYTRKFYSSHDTVVRCIAVLPNERIISGSHDGDLKVWNLKTGICDITYHGHSDWIICIATLPNGRIVTGSRDYTLKIWNLQIEKNEITLAETLVGHSDSVLCISVLPDDFSGCFTERLISGSCDQTLKIWNLQSQNIVNPYDVTTLHGHSNYVTCIALLPDDLSVSGFAKRDKRIVTGSGYELKIWNVRTCTCDNTIYLNSVNCMYDDLPPFGDYGVKCIVVLSDGTIVTGSQNGKLQLWDINIGKCIKTIEGHITAITCIAILPDGQIISGSGRTIRVWDVQTEQCDNILLGHMNWIRCINILSDGRIISGSNDRTIKIWT